MQRLFLDISPESHPLQLPPDMYHHLINVCKLSIGDTFEAVYNQTLYQRMITRIDGPLIYTSNQGQSTLKSNRPYGISLIQCLPKQDKLVTIGRMCTEAGITELFPVINEFSEVRILRDAKQKRVQRAVENAAKQSKQAHVPRVHAAQLLKDYATTHPFKDTALRLMADETCQASLSDTIKQPIQHIYLAIGPEGGFSPTDRQILHTAGFISFRLGEHILRTEHAGFAAINYIDGFVAG
jgi:16S rRNA (uracil1498-N3)-methyltransferase